MTCRKTNQWSIFFVSVYFKHAFSLQFTSILLFISFYIEVSFFHSFYLLFFVSDPNKLSFEQSEDPINSQLVKQVRPSWEAWQIYRSNERNIWSRHIFLTNTPRKNRQLEITSIRYNRQILAEEILHTTRETASELVEEWGICRLYDQRHNQLNSKRHRENNPGE